LIFIYPKIYKLFGKVFNIKNNCKFMALEDFFRNGNYIAFFGSFIHSGHGRDIDFTLFTTNGKNPFNGFPDHSQEIRDFVADNLTDKITRFDFTGIGPYRMKPYKAGRLPKEDIWLDYIYLTGLFFPNMDFVKQHYQCLFNSHHLTNPWLRVSEMVLQWPLQGVRLDKREEEMPLLLKAAERLAEEHHELNKVISRYRRAHKRLVDNGIYHYGCLSYYSRLSDMAKRFTSDVNAVLA
jgi:hypothetical protein